MTRKDGLLALPDLSWRGDSLRVINPAVCPIDADGLRFLLVAFPRCCSSPAQPPF